ncbi:MAG: HyaD/HybD family hydrogenase maturation endopeptidase [Candidatus Sulfotelmatobacter sp.]
MPAPATCVVLGLGNTLHSDDGIGPQAIERLRSDPGMPEDVALIEGGTLGLELLTYIWDCSYLLVLDAVDVGQPPGTLIRMSSEELQTLPGQGSVHQLGVADLLVALRVLAQRRPTVVLLGVQPATTDWGTELSPAVEAVMGSLIEAAVAELTRVKAITSA